jgi:hypothetical protein
MVVFFMARFLLRVNTIDLWSGLQGVLGAGVVNIQKTKSQNAGQNGSQNAHLTAAAIPNTHRSSAGLAQLVEHLICNPATSQ